MPDIVPVQRISNDTIRIVSVAGDVAQPVNVISNDSIRPASIKDERMRAVKADTAIVYYNADPYEGEYIITPKTEQQVMPTRNKQMRDDVTVKSVPYYETSNASGTTVYIAAEL